MPHLSFPVTADGLTLNVLIGLNDQETKALLAAGSAIPTPLWARAVIDSGSDVTAVSQGLLRQLGTAAFMPASTQTAAGILRVQLYRISLSISGAKGATGPMLVRPNLLVSELSILLPDIDVLIGMDILRECLFVLDGPGGQFTLAF